MDIKSLSSLIDESRKFIKISLEKRGKKSITSFEKFEGFNLKDWKKKLACNGFIRDQTVNLQGDQTEKVYDELIQMGYDSDQIVFNL